MKHVNEIGFCLTCEHCVKRHYDAHHGPKKNKYPYICLLTCKAVCGRGIPISVNSQIYPCRYTGDHDGYKPRNTN